MPQRHRERGGKSTDTSSQATLISVEAVMETESVTLSIPKETLRRAEVLAVRRGVSLPSLLTEALEDLVQREHRYSAARQRQLSLLEQGLPLGTDGQVSWPREALHEP
jgi:hypothetical protein